MEKGVREVILKTFATSEIIDLCTPATSAQADTPGSRQAGSFSQKATAMKIQAAVFVTLLASRCQYLRKMEFVARSRVTKCWNNSAGVTVHSIPEAPPETSDLYKTTSPA